MKRQQPERHKVRRPSIAYLRKIEPQLKRKYDVFYWMAPPDLSKLRPHVAQQYWLDGYSRGVFDLTIITVKDDAVKPYLIEFKYGYNGYTDEQKQIAKCCDDTPIHAVKIKSIDEFIEFCEVNLLK